MSTDLLFPRDDTDKCPKIFPINKFISFDKPNLLHNEVIEKKESPAPILSTIFDLKAEHSEKLFFEKAIAPYDLLSQIFYLILFFRELLITNLLLLLF